MAMADLTLDELSEYDGKNGRPAFFACKGIVYDVSDSGYFTEGEHLNTHKCGRDLTEELKTAPHGEEFFFDIKKVGKLITRVGR
jgi:predicted heme/steroid binding protein